MLKLPAMHFIGIIILLLSVFFAQHPAQTVPDQPEITRPAAGTVLRGVVEIHGSSQVNGFISAEIAFAFESEDTWFLIAQSNQGVKNARLARWDTTVIADGTYSLRLKVFRKDGGALEVLARGLRVRNYSPVETAAPTRQQTAPATAMPSATLAPLALLATPTALPVNPAEVTGVELSAVAVQGVVITLFIFLVIGVYVGIRRLARGG